MEPNVMTLIAALIAIFTIVSFTTMYVIAKSSITVNFIQIVLWSSAITYLFYYFNFV